jgi:tRNA pseudouridine38-40 synthase
MVPGEQRRIAFTVHYDGGSFFGWQLQPEHRSVQGEIEKVLSRLFAAPARVIGSGRTDRGVHATGQVASVAAPARWSARELRRAMNALLPGDVWVAHAAEVSWDFHPRYGAVERSYLYRVGLVDATRSPFHAPWCWPLGRSLSLDRMASGAATLVGDHSFLAFAKAGQEERGDRCIVGQAEWRPWGDAGVEFHVTANRFLHHMVRYLVGTLVEIGLDRRPVGDIEALLSGVPGLETSPPAPPQGLFLTRVTYPPGSYTATDRAPGTKEERGG